MPHRTRLALFYTFVGLFLLLGTVILLYSFGWRIDLETGKIQKIGAIYVKTNVRDTTIKLNNKTYKDEAGIIQSGTLISSLLPKTYSIEISKEGYLPYHKTLTVKPSRVEEILNVQLIPKTFEPTFVAPTKGTQFIDTTENADRIILQDPTTSVYYLYDETHASSTVNLNMAAANAHRGQKIKHIAFIPFKPTQFILEDTSGLKLFDLEKRTLEQLTKGTVTAWSIQDSTAIMAGTTKSGTQEISSFNLIFKTKSTFDDLNKQLSQDMHITMIKMSGNGNEIAFMTDTNELFLFTQKDKLLKRIAGNGKSFAFSPDNKKLLTLSTSGDLSILFLEDFDGDIPKKKGDHIEIVLPQKESVEAVQWYGDSYHLFINYPSALDITELDDRKPRNIFPILRNFIDYRFIGKKKSVYFTDAEGIETIRIEQ